MQNKINDTVAIIGAGNMGASMARGMLAQGWQAANILLVEKLEDKHAELRQQFPGCNITTIENDLLQQASDIILAVKPNDLTETCKQLRSVASDKSKRYISIAAGVTLTSLRNWLHPDALLFRCMPNTPAAIGLGITGIYSEQSDDQANREKVDNILRCSGKTLWVSDEAMLDAVTAVSGSGPAYLFYFMECLQNAGQKLGLSKQDSYELTLQTMYGAASLAKHNQLDFAELRKAVTSKGGTTEQALLQFMQAEFATIIEQAAQAAALRAKQISDSFQAE